jgi:hypothetical protein
MSDQPLDPLRRAHEDDFFRKRNQELIEKMRQKLSTEEAAADLKAATQLDDEELIHQLSALGITRETLPVLHLVPLLQVAWADGEIQDEERVLLLQAADEANVTGPARTTFEGMLHKQPSPEFFDASMSFIKAMLAAMPEDKAQDAAANLQALTWRVADAAGGLFGLFGRVGGTEKAALRQIAERLGDRGGDLLKKL